jgi:hypothetical protein
MDEVKSDEVKQVSPGRKMVSHWSHVSGMYMRTAAFLAWIEREYDIRLDYSQCTPERRALLDCNKLLDEFFQVDRKLLEQGRREWLELLRSDAQIHNEEGGSTCQNST